MITFVKLYFFFLKSKYIPLKVKRLRYVFFIKLFFFFFNNKIILINWRSSNYNCSWLIIVTIIVTRSITILRRIQIFHKEVQSKGLLELLPSFIMSRSMIIKFWQYAASSQQLYIWRLVRQKFSFFYRFESVSMVLTNGANEAPITFGA